MAPDHFLVTRISVGLFRRFSKSGELDALVLGATLLGLCGALLSCQSQKAAPLSLQVGPDQTIVFEPVSSFAHYYELPGHGDLLRIVFANYQVGCESYSPPAEGQVYIAVRVQTSSSAALEEGEYPWAGNSSDEKDPPGPRAMPYVRLEKEGRVLPAGGGLKITTLEKSAMGRVAGVLGFRDGGAGEAPTASLVGAFSVRLCHADLDPTRAKQDRN